MIALSALAMKADEERSKIAGCDAYIAKPLRYRELYEAIDALLISSGSSRQETGPEAVVRETVVRETVVRETVVHETIAPIGATSPLNPDSS